jgi:hypothetical protein
MLAMLLLASVLWVSCYFVVVLPAFQLESALVVCVQRDSEAKCTAKVVFFLFVWFSLARILLFVPCVAGRVARMPARSCRAYLATLVLDRGPLYLFVVHSLFFWFHTMHTSECETSNAALYRILRLYAAQSCLVSTLCFAVYLWHNKLITEQLQESLAVARPSRRAPPGTAERLETCSYNTEFFGNEEGKPYPADCAICLSAWEPDDVIKVTPCGHAFHDECISNWLCAARTCAICRRDLAAEGSDGATAAPTTPPEGADAGRDSSVEDRSFSALWTLRPFGASRAASRSGPHAQAMGQPTLEDGVAAAAAAHRIGWVDGAAGRRVVGGSGSARVQWLRA